CAFASLREASAQTPIRVSGDSAFRYAPSVTDSNTQQSVQFIRGDFTTFDVALFDNGILHGNLSRFTSISLAVFGTQNDTNPPQMLLSVTNVLSVPYFNTNTLTAAQWSNNPSGSTNYSAEFNFTDAQTSISLNSQPSASFWLRLFATTTDSVPRVVTYLEAPITVYDGPISPSYVQPSWYFGVFTDINGNLISPSDLWTQNEAGIAAALTAGGFSGGSGGVPLHNGQSSNQVLYLPITTNLTEMGTLMVSTIVSANSQPLTLAGMAHFPQPANAYSGTFVFGAQTGTMPGYPELVDEMPLSFLQPQYDDLHVVCGNSNNFTGRWMADATISTPGVWENFTNITFSSVGTTVNYYATLADRRIIDNPGITGTNCQVTLPKFTPPETFPGITNWTRWINVNATVGLNYFDNSAG